MPILAPSVRRAPALRSLLLAAFFLVLAAPVEGQRLRVVVENARTEEPVAAAVVELLGTSGERFDVALTDSVGLVVFTLPAAGRYQLRARHADHGTALSEILTVGEDEWQDIRLFLGIEVYTLAPIEVVGSSRRDRLTRGREYFAAHQQLGLGRLLTREDIRAKGAHVVSEIFMGEEGLGVLPGEWPVLASNRGWRCIHVYVNLLRGAGTPSFNGGKGPNIDSYLDVETLEGIEIYREFKEVPKEWQHLAWPAEELGANPGPPCGLLLIWTKAAW